MIIIIIMDSNGSGINKQRNNNIKAIISRESVSKAKASSSINGGEIKKWRGENNGMASAVMSISVNGVIISESI